MRNKEISIRSKDIKEFYIQYLELVKPIFNLSKTERHVVSLILYYSYIYRNIEDITHRMTVVFSTSCRADIREELDLSKEYFNNLIFRLRKKGILKGNLINKNLYIELNGKNFELNFNFYVAEESK
jgi:hypothetical protein